MEEMKSLVTEQWEITKESFATRGYPRAGTKSSSKEIPIWSVIFATTPQCTAN
jgi:hypothetical protein